MIVPTHHMSPMFVLTNDAYDARGAVCVENGKYVGRDTAGAPLFAVKDFTAAVKRSAALGMHAVAAGYYHGPREAYQEVEEALRAPLLVEAATQRAAEEAAAEAHEAARPATEWRAGPVSTWDPERLAPFLPAFLVVLAEIEAAGKYRYNASFKGRVPGIEGDDEDTAIYLLQGLERDRREAARVQELLAAGYEHVTHVGTPQKYSHVVLYTTKKMAGEWAEYHDVRVTGTTKGLPYGLIPKGRRTHGYAVAGRQVLAHR